MKPKQKKRFFTNHSKSSAMVVSLVLHVILLVIALSFVAVTVAIKNETTFEAKPVNRPKMAIKKLQVPVNIKKKAPKPKLRKRILVQPKMNQSMPDIKMPEITGIKGGLGAAGAGLGDGGSIGFSMPEIEVFGIRSKGEKVFLALDTDRMLLDDSVGGVRAYTIIKDELNKIIDGFSPTTLFNVAVFEHHQTILLFPKMVPAIRGNKARVEKWLNPLNKALTATKTEDFGIKTIGAGGTAVNDDFDGWGLKPVEWANSSRYWYTPVGVAMQEQADTIFVLTGSWGIMRYIKGEVPEWDPKKRQRWEELYKEAQKLLAEENKERNAKGEPARVLRGPGQYILAYFPEEYESVKWPEPEVQNYTPKDFAKSIHLLRKDYEPKVPAKSGLTKRKSEFSVNVIFFARKDGVVVQAPHIENFRQLARLCNGESRCLAGLEAIESSVSGN